MAAESTLKNMVLCLAGVCLACSALLGVTNLVTAEPIGNAKKLALEKSIKEVLPEGGELSEALTAVLGDEEYSYYRSSEDSVTLSYAVKSSVNGFGGPLVLMVGVLPDGSVYNTSVLECNETPGLGAKCKTDESFFGQFRNFPASGKLSLKKDGGDIDAITASTITSRAYAKAVSNAVDLVASLQAGQSGSNMEDACNE